MLPRIAKPRVVTDQDASLGCRALTRHPCFLGTLQVNMTNMPPTIVKHQRHLAMLTELQEAIDAEADMKAEHPPKSLKPPTPPLGTGQACVRAVKEARAAKNAKLSDIRAAETKLVEWYPEFVREVQTRNPGHRALRARRSEL